VKEVRIEQLKYTYDNFDSIIYEMMRRMKSHSKKMLFDVAVEIAKQMVTEYVNLSFLSETASF
jgi:hypothetical protein